MRILFITAFYPPYVVGGWEQLVQDVNIRLQSRGHTTHILTSTYGLDAPECDQTVSRLLSLESDLYHYDPKQFLGHKARLDQNLAQTRETIEQFQPDVIFVHVMWNLSRGIAHLAEQLCPGRVVYYVANDWPHADDPHTAYWRDPAGNPLARLAKQMLAPLPLKMIERENNSFNLKFERVLCVSNAVKKDLAHNAGIPVENMHVVYNGVETDLFIPAEGRLDRKYQPSHGLKLVYAGSLNTHKGVHTAVEAMAILAKTGRLGNTTLSLIGSGHPSYEAHLKKLVSEAGTEAAVKFLGRVPREDMPILLKQFDVLIFPSIWEEPLARMTQEAMAAGLLVIGTLTGGTGELLVEGETGLTFEAKNAAMLAQRIAELQENPAEWGRLVKAGREKVLALFDIERMIDEIEAHLAEVIGTTDKVLPL